MAKINVYKVVNPPRVSSRASTNIQYVGASLNANTKALNGLGSTLSGIAATSNGLSGVANASLKESKLREIRDRRAAQRERDRLREEQRESSVIKGPEKVKEQPKPTGKVKSWMEKVFGGLFGWLAPLAKAAITFFGALFAMKAAKDLQQALQDPSVREKFTKFFEKAAFVARKLFGIGSWLIKDNLLEGFNNAFGQNKTVGERLKGLGQMMIGIVGLRTLLNPFGTMMQIMNLMNLRSREMNAADRRLRLREQRLAAENAKLRKDQGRNNRGPQGRKDTRTKPKTKPRPDPTEAVRDRNRPNQTAAALDDSRIRSGQTGSNVVRRSDAAGNQISPGAQYRAQVARSRVAPTFQQRPTSRLGGVRYDATRSTLPTAGPISLNRSEGARIGRVNQSWSRALAGQAGPIDNLRLLRRGFIKQNRFQTVTRNLARSGARGLFRAPGRLLGAARTVSQIPGNLRTGFNNRITQPVKGVATGALRGLGLSANAVKGVLGTVKNLFGRVPWLGVLLTGVFELFDVQEVKENGEVKSKIVFRKERLGKALFKAGGAAIGGVIGSFIPIPVIGTLIGTTLGAYGGDLLHMLVNGTDPKVIGQIILKDAADTLERTGKIASMVGEFIGGVIEKYVPQINKWVSERVDRLYKSLSKFKLTDFVHESLRWVLKPLGQLAELKIPNPLQFLNPFELAPKAYDALFTQKPIVDGKLEQPKQDLPTLKPEEVKGLNEAAQDALGSEIDQTKTLSSQITRNYGYKTGQNFFFHHKGVKYRAQLQSDGWHFYYDYTAFQRRGALQEIPVSTTKSTWLLNVFINSIKNPSGAIKGRTRGTAYLDHYPEEDLRTLKDIGDPEAFDFPDGEYTNKQQAILDNIRSKHITGSSGAYYRRDGDGRYLGSSLEAATINLMRMLEYGSGAYNVFDSFPTGSAPVVQRPDGLTPPGQVTSPDPSPEQPGRSPNVPAVENFPAPDASGNYSSESTPLSLTGTAKARVGNDTEFLNGLVAMSNRLGASPSDMLAKMASESSLQPWAQNKKTLATGLIQMLPATAASLGTSVQKLQKMTRSEQLPYIEKFLRKAYAGAPRPLTAGQLYTGTFLPAFVKAPADSVIATESGTGIVEGYGKFSPGEVQGWYANNDGLDLNGDGKIQIFELSERIDEIKRSFGIGGGTIKGVVPGSPDRETPVQPQTPVVSDAFPAPSAVLDVPPEMSQDLKNVTANHGPLLGGPTKDVEFKAGQGDKSRRIFLHWTGGFSNQPSTRYHTTFTGDGKAHRNTENYGIDKGNHTGGANGNSVGLSLAAMGHRGMTQTYYDERKGWAENPPTGAQIQAMALEAARLAHAWGWNASTIQSNVRTHGEWERYGTREGLLSGRPQRWDLDQLRPGQPFDQSQIRSNGGNEMRALITAYFNKIKAAEAQGADQLGQVRQSSPTPTPILQLPEGVVLTSNYGVMRGDKMHGGTDIAAPSGTDLVAPTDGTIVDYGSLEETGAKRGDPNGWGNFIVFKDKNGMYHLYGHILQGFSKSGTFREGQKIADVGSTGKSSGPHLHWELGTNWTGGVLQGLSDPLKTYRLEAPFIGQNMRGAAASDPTQQVPGPQMQQRQASIMDGVLVVPPSLAGDNVPIDDAVVPKIIQGLTEGTLKAFQAPVGSAAGILDMFKQGAGAIQRGLQPLYDKAGQFIGYARGKAGDAANAVSDAAGDLFGGADSNIFENDNPYGIQKQTDAFGNPLDPYDFARRQAPMELPLIETYNTLHKQWEETLGPQKISLDDVKNSYFGGRNLSIDQGLEIFQMQLQDALTPKPQTFKGPEGNDIQFPALQPLPPLPESSDGGSVTPLPNNLQGFFLGKVFKSIGKAISGAFNAVKNAVVSITNNPIFKIVTTAVSIFVPPLAPVIAGINAVSSLMQGDIIGAVVGGFGALGGAFPGTFGAEGTFFAGLNKTFGEGLGGVFKGFLTGGIGGAIGGIGQALAPGLKNLLGGLGGFMDKNPQIGKMLGSLVNMTGMQGLLGPALEGAGVSPTGAVTQQADAAGGLISAVLKMGLGMATKALGLEQAAGAIGVNPAAFGVAPPASRLLNMQDQVMQQMAQFGPIEVAHVPVIVEKLVAIQEPVPIIQTQIKYKPAPPQQQNVQPQE